MREEDEQRRSVQSLYQRLKDEQMQYHLRPLDVTSTNSVGMVMVLRKCSINKNQKEQSFGAWLASGPSYLSEILFLSFVLRT